VSFNPQPLNDVAAWIEVQRSIWEERFDALDALLKEEIAAEREQAAGRSLPSSIPRVPPTSQDSTETQP
jgi:hypothetical protein